MSASEPLHGTIWWLSPRSGMAQHFPFGVPTKTVARATGVETQ